MSRLQLTDAYDNKRVVSMTVARVKTAKCYSEVWSRKSCKVSKIRTYRIFKTNFCKAEPYLPIQLQKHELSLLAQFTYKYKNVAIRG